MALLRMLAFRPQAASSPTPAAPVRGASTAPAAASTPHAGAPRAAPRAVAPPPVSAAQTAPPAAAPPSAPPAAVVAIRAPAAAADPSPSLAPIALDGNGLPDWDALIARAGLRGPLGMLAQNAVLRDREGRTLVLALQTRTCTWRWNRWSPDGGAHRRGAGRAGALALCQGQQSGRRRAARLPRVPRRRTMWRRRQPKQSIAADPLVQALKREFGARVVPRSVKPFAQ